MRDMRAERCCRRSSASSTMLKVKPIRADEVNALNRQDPRRAARSSATRGFVTNTTARTAPSPASACSAARSTPSRACSSPTCRRADARRRAHLRQLRACAASSPRPGACARVEGEVVDALGRPRHASRSTAQVVVLCAGAINSPATAAAQRHRERQRPGRPQPAPAPVGPARRASTTRTSTATAASRRATTSTSSSTSSSDPDSGYILMPVVRLPGDDGDAAARLRPRALRDRCGTSTAWSASWCCMHDQSSGRVAIDRTRPAADHATRVNAQGAAALRRGHEALRRDPLRQRRDASDGAVRAGRCVLEPGDDRSTSSSSAACARATSRSPRPIRRAPAGWARIPRARWSTPTASRTTCRNLFVCDMSVFPTSLGAPPQISTAALADRTAHYIKDQWECAWVKQREA